MITIILKSLFRFSNSSYSYYVYKISIDWAITLNSPLGAVNKRCPHSGGGDFVQCDIFRTS